ncbi:MAG: glycosyltransferase [Bacillota bacterium]
MYNYLQEKILKYSLSKQVYLLGSMDAKSLRLNMNESSILFTSNFKEGWGAVLSEAMDSCCAVVASHACGSVPFLIQNNKNGIVYPYNDFNYMYEQIEMLINSPSFRIKLGINAHNDITEYWNAATAVERLINLSESIIQDEKAHYEKGPCSSALIVKNNWYKK